MHTQIIIHHLDLEGSTIVTNGRISKASMWQTHIMPKHQWQLSIIMLHKCLHKVDHGETALANITHLKIMCRSREAHGTTKPRILNGYV